MNRKMYKEELISKIAKETRLSQRIVADVLTDALRQITQAVAEGKQVHLVGFGVFEARHRGEGQVKHIKTGKTISYPARLLPIFRAGDLFKQAVRRAKPTKTRKTKKK